ncbi:MAG: folate-binding protein YgfZ [Gammaproteobacteria bacterium]|nr:folate-binding protein YgfZ [Gammaproteobacteria bacterium]
MQDVWQAVLEKSSAQIANDKVEHFGQPESEIAAVNTANVICDLSHLGIIRVSGADAKDFLQNQLTNDVNQVSATQSQLNAYCNPKGRILASFRLFMRDGDYIMHMPWTIIDPTLNRLKMFVLRSQVELKDSSDDWIRIGVAGQESEKLITDQLGDCPQQVDEVMQIESATVIRLPGTLPRFELHAPVDKMQSLWQALSQQATPVGASCWSHLDILAGIPVIQTQTTDSFVPQMVNLHVINGVSFKKGCYPGQEIVARMQYLGKLKRRMYLAHVNTDATINPGDELFSSGDNKQSIGKVVEAATAFTGGYDLLAVIQIAEQTKADVLLHNKQGAKLEFHDLPYQVEE